MTQPLNITVAAAEKLAEIATRHTPERLLAINDAVGIIYRVAGGLNMAGLSAAEIQSLFDIAMLTVREGERQAKLMTDPAVTGSMGERFANMASSADDLVTATSAMLRGITIEEERERHAAVEQRRRERAEQHKEDYAGEDGLTADERALLEMTPVTTC